MERKIIKWYFNFLFYHPTYPYKLHWNQSRYQVYFNLNKKSVHFSFWKYFNYFLPCTYFIIIVSLLLIKLAEYKAGNDFISLTFHAVWITCIFSSVLNQFPHFFLGQQIATLNNATEDLIENMEETHFQPESFKKSQKTRANILAFLVVYSIFSVTSFIPVTILFMDNVWQLGSHFCRAILTICGYQFKHVALLLGVIIDLWQLGGCWAAGLMMFQLNLVFMHTFKTSVRLIMENKLKRRWSMISTAEVPGSKSILLSRLREDMLIYSKLRVLTTAYNDIWGMVYVGQFKSLLAACIVEFTFIAVRLPHDPLILLVGISTAGICVAVLAVLITFFAMVNEYSLKLKEDLLSRKLGKIKEARRIINAFRVEAVKCGNFYIIKRMTCLTVLALISNLTGSVLISFKM